MSCDIWPGGAAEQRLPTCFAMARRARSCFVCGKLGHLASECESPGRVCFNCGQMGHESNDCPQPHTAEQRQCYHCGQSGHLKADCSNERAEIPQTPAASAAPKAEESKPSKSRPAKAKPCFNCGEESHLARDCPAPPAAEPAFKPSSSSRVRCRNCSERGHFARDCHNDKRCYRCEGSGHVRIYFFFSLLRALNPPLTPNSHISLAPG